jgi:hypothetical protein
MPGYSHQHVVCLQHCAEKSKKALFCNIDDFISLNIEDQSVLNLLAVVYWMYIAQQNKLYIYFF